MKKVSSDIEFDFKHDGSTTVHLSPAPSEVTDDVADHLVRVFGERIKMSDEQTSEPTVAEQPASSPEAEVASTEEAPSEEKAEEDSSDKTDEVSDEPKKPRGRPKKEVAE